MIYFSLDTFITFVMSIFVICGGGEIQNSQQKSCGSSKDQTGAETFHCDRGF